MAVSGVEWGRAMGDSKDPCAGASCPVPCNSDAPSQGGQNGLGQYAHECV